MAAVRRRWRTGTRPARPRPEACRCLHHHGVVPAIHAAQGAAVAEGAGDGEEGAVGLVAGFADEGADGVAIGEAGGEARGGGVQGVRVRGEGPWRPAA